MFATREIPQNLAVVHLRRPTANACTRIQPIFFKVSACMSDFSLQERRQLEFVRLRTMLYSSSRPTSRNCRAVASRNVSTLAPEGMSSPDLAWIAKAIRCASANRVPMSMSNRREKKPSSTSRSADDSLATPLAGSVTLACGSGIGALRVKICAVNVRDPDSPHSGISVSRSRTTSVPAARSPNRWCWREANTAMIPTP